MEHAKQHNEQHSDSGMNPYLKFTLMIVTSTLVMYVMMYFNTYAWKKKKFNKKRAQLSCNMVQGRAV